MGSRRKILFTTGIRSDFFIQAPLMHAVNDHPDLTCQIIVTGAHLHERFGNTVKEVEEQDLPIVARVPNLVESDARSARIKGVADQMNGIVDVFEREAPDIVIAPFDREEAMSVALCGTYMNILIAHLGAGDRTKVNVDGIVRHSVSKLSHLLLTSTESNRQRLIRMGEEEKRVFNVGHVGLDRYRRTSEVNRAEIGIFFGFNLSDRPLIVVIQHPVSSQSELAGEEILPTLMAVDQLGLPTVIIHPNSDPGRVAMVSAIEHFQFTNSDVRVIVNLPETQFINMMRHASVLVGNSSMGVLEAPMLNLPVVNVGERQMDRENVGNIVFVPHDLQPILRALENCLYDREFHKSIENAESAYGDGNSSQRIVDTLIELQIDEQLLVKQVTY